MSWAGRRVVSPRSATHLAGLAGDGLRARGASDRHDLDIRCARHSRSRYSRRAARSSARLVAEAARELPAGPWFCTRRRRRAQGGRRSASGSASWRLPTSPVPRPGLQDRSRSPEMAMISVRPWLRSWWPLSRRRPAGSHRCVLESHEGLRLVATDSYRLALRDLPAVRSSISALIPARALRELHRTVAAKKMRMCCGEPGGVVRLRAGGRSRYGSSRGPSPTTASSLPASYPQSPHGGPGAPTRGHRSGLAGGRGSHPAFDCSCRAGESS